MKYFLFFLFPIALFALPQKCEAQKGVATQKGSGGHLEVENSKNTILHWESFSIGHGESVHFAQHSTKSAVLNRVTSKECSHIFGHLTSNGKVILVNPNGVHFGKDSYVQTAGFIASTAKTVDFSNEQYVFSDPGEGQIVNHGKINCPMGDIYLIAKTIHNDGTMTAENVSMISAYEVAITPHQDKKVSIRLDLDADEIASLAEGLERGSPYEKAIHHTGKVELISAKEENGRVFLFAQNGEVAVEGSVQSHGGDIHVLGEEVRALKGTALDSSGPSAGTILIGGDRGGEDLYGMNARNTTVENGAVISANSSEGDGGTVIVWSDQDTFCAGTINAKATGFAGDGGFLEISGKETVDTCIIPDLSSENGRGGTFLIDPGSVLVTMGAAAGPNTFGSAFINGVLVGANLIINTSAAAAGPETLTVDGTVIGVNDINWGSAFDLTLIGRRNVDILAGATIRATGAGNLTITGGGNAIAGNYPGVVITGATLTTNTGALSITGVGGDAAGPLTNDGILIQGASSLTSGASAGTAFTFAGTGGLGGNGISASGGSLSRTVSTGAFSVTGTGGSGAGPNVGVHMTGTGTDIFANGNGPITINATGTGTGAGSNGMSVLSAAQIGSALPALSGTSAVTATTTASSVASSSNGIFLSGAGTQLLTQAGLLTLTAEGGGVGDNNNGILIASDADIFGSPGSLTIEATGTSTGVNNNYGISLTAGLGDIRTSTGSITITQATGSSASPSIGTGNNGINLTDAHGGIVATTGSISITATGATNSTGDGNVGVNLEGSTNTETISTTSGDITIVATGAPFGANDCIGVRLIDDVPAGINSRRIASSTGNIDIQAFGAGPTSTGSRNIGLDVDDEGVILSGGSVDITAIGHGLGSDCRGIDLASQALITSSASAVTVNAIGSPTSATGDGHIGIKMVDNNGGLTAAASGTIDITATGAAISTGNNNIGIDMEGIDDPKRITTTNGNITIVATGAPFGGSGNIGIRLIDTDTVGVDPRSISTVGGILDITATGVGPTGGGSNTGLFLGNDSTITGRNTVMIDATGGGLGSSCIGIYMTSQAIISSTISGTLDITAVGSPDSLTGSSHMGIQMENLNGSIQSSAGAVTINATGATQSTGDTNIGINMSGATAAGASTIFSASGTLTVNATGATSGGSGNIGIRMRNDTPANIAPRRIQNINGPIVVTAIGSGAATGSDNVGLFMGDDSLIQSITNSNITVNAMSGGSGSRNRGIHMIENSHVFAVGTGPISMTGTGGTTSGVDNEGILIQSSTLPLARVQSINGPLSLTGNGGFASPGIHVDGGTIFSTGVAGTGTISCTGIGGTGGPSQGIIITGASSDVTNASAAITMTGTGNGAGVNADGIQIINAGRVAAFSTGNVTFDGTGSITGTGASRGIFINGAGSTVTSVSGNMVFCGIGGNAGSGNNGLEVSGTGVISSSNGVITGNCLGGANGTSDNNGILVTDSGSRITMTNGGSNLVGTGRGTTTDNNGILVTNGGLINSTAGANLQLTGNGSTTGTTGNDGIEVNGAAALITTVSGNIPLMATGGGSSSDNRGIYVAAGGGIESSSGAITGTVTGGSGSTGCTGILVTGTSSEITSATGSINLTGTGAGTGAANPGIHLEDSGSITTSGISAPITLTGNGTLAGTGASPGIFVDGAGSLISTSTGNIILAGTGGTGGVGNSGLEVSGGGVITSSDGVISGSSTGGSGTDSNNGVLVTGAGSRITMTNGGSNLIGIGGGTGMENNGILVSSGGMINSTAGANLTLEGRGATTGTLSNDGIEVVGANSLITTVSGNIPLMATGGGSLSDNVALFVRGGGGITTTSGSITCDATGGTGSSGCLGISVTGANSQITSDTGSVNLTGMGGGTGAGNSGIEVFNAGRIFSVASAPITLTGTGFPFGSSINEGIHISGVGSEVSSDSGTITLSGTAGGGTLEGIIVEQSGRVLSSTSGDIIVSTFSDLLVTSSGNIDSAGTGTATFNITTDVRVLGGTGASTSAYINLTDGAGTFDIGRDLTMVGGTGSDAFAQIGNIGGTASASAPMTFTVGRDVNITAAAGNSYAIIGHGELSTPQTLSGDISMTVTRDINVTGASTGGFAQIGHLDETGGGSTLVGDLFGTCRRNITLQGGTDLTGFARIGNGGQSGGTTINPGTILFIAGENVSLLTNVGEAQAQNLNGTLTLVCDDLFPVSPGIGLGAFTINTNSLLTATGELRVYTARRPLNSITEDINGVPFVPGTIFVDSPSEQWLTYFNDGTYVGVPFKIYYKDTGTTLPDPIPGPIPDPAPGPVPMLIVRQVAANMAELPELLGFTDGLDSPPNIFQYHFMICYEDEKMEKCSEEEICDKDDKWERRCAPTLSPYGSFIFEDDVWWIGTSF